MKSSRVFHDIINVVEANTKKTENYLSIQAGVSLEFRHTIKSLYDFTKEESGRMTEALPELITEGFDTEQIWQQLELQNEGELPHILTGVSRSLIAGKRLKLPVKLTRSDEQQSNGKSGLDQSLDGEQVSTYDSDLSDGDLSNLDIEGLGKQMRKKKSKRVAKRKTPPSIVDDKFFKLQELDEYLTKEDKREMQKGKSNEEDSDDADEESVDLFEYVSDNGSEDDETDPRLVKFKDFFDQPQSNDESNSETESNHFNEESENDTNLSVDEEETTEPHKKRVKFSVNDQSASSSSEEDESKKEGTTEIKSSLETRQERLRRKIEELEEAAISEKPWQLKGEVDAASRPQDSLLQEHVEFDITSRPAPVITEETTLKLEDIIKQRIKDKAWDDVEKKFKPVETPMEYKKKLVLDQEKSKLSLAQIYENEYLKQKEALNPDNEERETEEPKEHIEIRNMMHSLFSKLDALSNFHYTPKLARPDVKIVSNLPAVTMEEVAPIATSDATLLAPEEIKAKSRGDLIGRAERTETDMKRERRQKKLNQRDREKAKEKREKIVGKLKPGLGNKYSKEKAAKMIDSLSKERNISKIDETSGKTAKSSTAFFDQLQDQVNFHIKSKDGNVRNKKDKKALSAVKLKL
ncbi:U3 small nucleolar ribonucleoprotein protein MPP10 [Neodiprion virginianus]|uniref:U3 small nucleolar ribonucleoprotein protein MPP10 n=1 Tax=Neodiprion virginianus TaxID=2961670 RepID=UPI001EE6A6DA|nr:U3 small nucleolar ribonucleoprotein protein MPP10 [Neodiprion virginianus]